jgi:hypothetical protein
MISDYIMDLFKSFILGKTKPGMDADPLILFGWACVTGLFLMAAAFARPPRAPGLAVSAGGLAMLISAAILGHVTGVPSGVFGPHKGANSTTGQTVKVPPGPPVKADTGSVPGGAGQRPPVPPQPPRPPQPVRFDRLENTVLTGRRWANARVMPMSECLDICRRDEPCVALVYDGNKCEMKSELGQPEKFDGAVSMIKRKP